MWYVNPMILGDTSSGDLSLLDAVGISLRGSLGLFYVIPASRTGFQSALTHINP
jgi:hypothetical protein